MNEDTQQPSSGRTDGDEIDLVQLWGLLMDHRWKIAGITALAMLLGGLYAFLATPIYQADAMLQVESKRSGMPGMGEEMRDLFDSDGSAETEMQILRSRLVLGATVDELRLDIDVRPDQKGFWGGNLDNRMLFSGWEDEERLLEVERLEASDYWQDRELILEVEEEGRFRVEHEGEELLSGSVGEDVSTEAADIHLHLSRLEAEPGTRFVLVKRPRRAVIDSLRNAMSVSERGNYTGILEVSLTGEDRNRVREILETVTRNYVMQNIRRTAEEAERSLEFLEEQLPRVRDELNQAEDEFNRYRLEAESVDVSRETEAMLDRLVELESRMNEMRFRENELQRLYTREHPAYATLLDQQQSVQAEKERIEERIKDLPEKQQQILRLRRDVDLNQEIYLQLVNRAQELRVVRAGTVGNVRVIDEAMLQPHPVEPRRRLIMGLSLVLGGMVGVGGALASGLLRRGLESPAELEELGIPVYASIPLSETQKTLSRWLQPGASSSISDFALLSTRAPDDPAVEAIRSLRTSLHFAMLESFNSVLMFSGSSPEVGKTFLTANLGAVLADAGQRVLVIDADMRRGHLHRYLAGRADWGLSEYLAGQATREEILQDSGLENLHFLSRGMAPPNPSELLMHPRLEELLGNASDNYDVVLVDTPPILAVTDAAIIGCLSGSSLMVARYGRNSTAEIQHAIKRFRINGVEIRGCVVNCMERSAGNYYTYYPYDYRPR